MLTSMESGYVLVLNSTNMADMIGLHVEGCGVKSVGLSIQKWMLNKAPCMHFTMLLYNKRVDIMLLGKS